MAARRLHPAGKEKKRVNSLDTYLEDNGLGLAIGLILGIALVIFLVVIVAVGDRRPPDKKDGP